MDILSQCVCNYNNDIENYYILLYNKYMLSKKDSKERRLRDMNCASCGIKACKNNEENLANNCPNNKKEELNELKDFYQTEENFKIAQVAAELSIPQGLTRIEETMEFARRLKYKKIGLYFVLWCSILL